MSAPTSRSRWLNRGTALGLLIGLLVGVGVMALRNSIREQSMEQAKQDPPKEELKPEPVREQLLQAQKNAAQLSCQTVDKAIKAYQINPQNPGQTYEERLPEKQIDLVKPFGGTASLLEAGERELIDPWGKRYEFERRTRADGTVFIVVRTTAPDGTPISQYGIGEHAEPRNK